MGIVRTDEFRKDALNRSGFTGDQLGPVDV